MRFYRFSVTETTAGQYQTRGAMDFMTTLYVHDVTEFKRCLTSVVSVARIRRLVSCD
jgi:hypothetical protein